MNYWNAKIAQHLFKIQTMDHMGTRKEQIIL
jgi:hypothetical protein